MSADQNTDPAAVAAELQKEAEQIRNDTERMWSLYGASTYGGYVRADRREVVASVLEAAAARIRELEAERDELFGLFDRDQAAAPVQPRPPGWKARGLWEFAMLERRKRIKATKALREASELLANPGVWTPPVADALAIINTALRALAEEEQP